MSPAPVCAPIFQKKIAPAPCKAALLTFRKGTKANNPRHSQNITPAVNVKKS